MSTAALKASRALWNRRRAYRKRKHDFYHHHSKRPDAERKRLAIKWHKLEEEAAAMVARRDRQIAARQPKRPAASSEWGGSRTITNEVIAIVGNRAPVTSRKRTATFGNPGSDHHVSQTNADAVDFGIANAHWLKNEISRKLGGPSQLNDYGAITVTRNGRRYRVQMIAGTHGTGPHLHVGVRRV